MQVQGTVTSFETKLPIDSADVTIEWPWTLGGGITRVHTNEMGRYAVGLTLRTEQPNCEGIALSVTARGYAPVYHRHTKSGCGERVLSLDFALFPLGRP